ncbi:MAG: toll/interleukin-1 receptor domain-containing protein [Anaerovoracaceae bacterium]
MGKNESCFISYAWDEESRIKQFIECFVKCLENLQISSLVDMKCNSGIGSNIDDFIKKTMTVDSIIIIVSNRYIEKTKDCKTKVYQEWRNIQKRLGGECKILPILYDRNCTLPAEIGHLCTTEVSLLGLKNLIGQITGEDVSEEIIATAFSDFDLWKYQFQRATFLRAEVQQVAEQYAKHLFPAADWKIRDANCESMADGDIKIIDVTNQQFPVQPYLPLESFCLEGFFHNNLRIIVVATNGFIAPEFKYKLWSAYQSKNKTIIFLDKKELFFFRTAYGIRKDELSQVDVTENAYRVISCDYLTLENYVDLHTQILCPKDFYEMLYPYKDYFITRDSLIENEIYVFRLYIFATEALTLEIVDDEKTLPFSIIKFQDAPYVFTLEKGFNSVFFQVKANQTGTYKDQVLTFKDVERDICTDIRICSFEIEKSIFPIILFQQQTDIIFEITALLRENKDQKSGKAIVLLGNGGCGKSFILARLKEEVLHLKTYTSAQVLSIQFISETDTTNKNNILLSDLLFFLCSGLPFESNIEWLTNSNIAHIVLPPTFRRLIIALRTPNNELAIAEFLNELGKDSSQIIDKDVYFSAKKVVFLDDIQKLPALSAKLLQLIVALFLKNELSVEFIISGRPQKLEYFSDEFLQGNVGKKPFELGSMSLTDIKESIQHTTNIDKNILDASVLDSSFCNNVFYIRDLIRYLCHNVYKNLGDLNLALTSGNQKIKQENAYAKHFLDQFTNTERTYLNIIFTCKKFGLRVSWDSYFDLEILQKLASEKYITLQNDDVSVGHDIFLESFQPEYDKTLASYLTKLYDGEENEETKNNILALNILCAGAEMRWPLEEAYRRIITYFEATKFSAILLLAQAMMQHINSVGMDDFSPEQKAKITLIYANALNHAGKTNEAYIYFSKVSEYKRTGNDDIDALILEANTEKVNLDYWNLNTKNIFADLKQLREKTQAYLYLDSYTILKAHLNTYNREMVTQLLLDEYNDAHDTLQYYVKECESYENREYFGFAYMDYAKGIYNRDKTLALEYLEKANEIFQETGQIRRMLDCQCEIAFIRAVLQAGNMAKQNELKKTSDALKTNGLMAQYKKSILKLAAVRLQQCLPYANKLTNDFNVYTLFDTEELSSRNKLIMSNMDIIQHKVTQKPLYYDTTELLQLPIGKSYLDILMHNEKVLFQGNNKVAFVDSKQDYDKNTFLIDTRIW